MKIAFSDSLDPKAGAVVVLVEEGRKLSPAAQALDGATGGAIGRAVKSGRFTGKKNQTLLVPGLVGVEHDLALLVGIGKGLSAQDAEALGGTVQAALAHSGVKDAALQVDKGGKDLVALAVAAAEGVALRAYRFDKYRTKETADQKPSLKKLTVVTEKAGEAKKAYAQREKVVDGVIFTRDLVSEPANILYPESFAERLKELESLGVEVEILGEKQMKKLGMGALLGVGQGSERESLIVVMQWKGGAKDKAPVALVGKGVTFDTGGISIKPAAGMEEMKWDMGGAGAVAGAMKAIAGRKAKANVVGLVGLVENMPDGNAQRPGDVVTTMSGQTVEVINTDAEGRLVLADVMWYCQDRFKPAAMIDLATLTGAMIIALGHEYAGFFSNDDALAGKLSKAGEASGDKVWRFPLGDAYDKQIKSDIADMKNVGSRAAGSITAAQFLQRFVDKTAWAHIDIAGMAWASADSAVTPKGGTGFGVRLLDRLIADFYE